MDFHKIDAWDNEWARLYLNGHMARRHWLEQQPGAHRHDVRLSRRDAWWL